ncbi:MAG: Hpt domain-containing protein [Aliidongia sp.]
MLAREAHDLKSTSGSFGARRLQYLAESLETACRKNDVAATGTIAAAIAATVPDPVEAVLRRYPEIRIEPR